MLIPIGTNRPLIRPTLITYWLIGANVVLFIAQQMLGGGGQGSTVIDKYGAFGGSYGADWWRYVSYAFLHGGPMHLIGNMLFLWVFGPNVEDRIGRVPFVVFYLVAAVAAAFAHRFFSGLSPLAQAYFDTDIANGLTPKQAYASLMAETGWKVPFGAVVGASGSVAAVTGAYLVLFPNTRIRSILWFMVILPIEVPAIFFVLLAFFRDTLMAGLNVDSNVAHEAHIGGTVFGFAVAMALLAFRIIPKDAYDMFSMFSQAKRRRQIFAAHEQGMRNIQRAAIAHAKRPPDPRDTAAAQLRAHIGEAMMQGDHDQAAQLYRQLVDANADQPMRCELGRDLTIALANSLFAKQERQLAAFAYERFLESAPHDREASNVTLILALLNARYLNDPTRASVLLDGLDVRSLNDQEQALAATLTQELG